MIGNVRIDRSILFPLHVVKTLRGTGQQKEFIYYGLRQNGGAWGASKVEQSCKGKPASRFLKSKGSEGHILGARILILSQFSAQDEKMK